MDLGPREVAMYEGMTLGDLVRRNAKMFGDRTALVFENKRYTHKMLAERAFRAANALLDRGVAQQDRVAILAHNCSEVEEALRHHHAVAEVAVIGVPDPAWGESVKACIVLRDGMAASEDELITYCRSRIASYKKPRSIDSMTALPRIFKGSSTRRHCGRRIGPDRLVRCPETVDR